MLARSQISRESFPGTVPQCEISNQSKHQNHQEQDANIQAVIGYLEIESLQNL